MSQENVEIVRRAMDALSRGDFESFLEYWAQDAVVDWSRSRGLDPRVFRGHTEIRAFAERLREAFDEIQLELEDVSELEDGLLVAQNLAHMRSRTGVEVQARSAWLITIEGGQQTSLTLYQTKPEALEAVGLSG
jgi:ketosteroid isomerase-like protein